jgi:DNA polymerase-3 subunit delta'
MLQIDQGSHQSTQLIALDKYFDEMVNLYESSIFPRVMLLSGNKGIGKFTLVFHFLNYIYSKKEKNNYNLSEKLININSVFYNSILNKTCADVIFFQASENKNIKIEDVRNLKSVLSRTSLSNEPRFIIIDEVEFLNISSANALLKTLEEPTGNNFFILIDNKQADLIQTISSRCLKNNIYLNTQQKKKITDYLIELNKINFLITDTNSLTPGLLLKYSIFSKKYKIDANENILSKLKKVLYAYKKNKDKDLINMTFFLINDFFYKLAKKNNDKIYFLLDLKFNITNNINDFTIYNLNLSSVLNSIELKLKNVS